MDDRAADPSPVSPETRRRPHRATFRSDKDTPARKARSSPVSDSRTPMSTPGGMPAGRPGAYLPCFFSIRAQASFSVTVRLNTSDTARDSRSSATK